MKENAELRIYTLGGVSIEYGEQPLTLGKGGAQNLQLQLLLILLLHRDKGVAKKQLMDIFYENSEIENRNNSMNNLIYRLRKQLCKAGLPNEEYVAIKDGICVWSSSVPVWIDVQELENCYQQAQAGTPREKDLLLQVTELYRGELLPQMVTEDWVIVEGIRVKKLYYDSIHRLGVILTAQQDYREWLRVLARAVALYPYEEWQVYQMEALMALNRYEEAYQLYRETAKLYTQELQLPPSDKMLKCLEKMQNNLLMPEDTLERIRERMQEHEVNRAYYCAYPGFVDAYRVLCRLSDRSGASIFLMSCTLQQIRINKEKKNNARITDWLQTVICSSLRRGDVCTRYSRNQFLMLLTSMKQEHAGVITNRIREKFQQDGGTEGYELQFSILSALQGPYN